MAVDAVNGTAEFADMMPNISLGMDAAPPAYVSIGQLIASGDLATGNMTTLAGSVNAVPFEPSYLGSRGIFNYEPALTNTIQIEFDGQVINLVPATPPGAPGYETTLNPRNVKSITAPRIARKVTVLATEVAGVRALASTGFDTVETRGDRKLKNAVRDIRSTMEFHRLGAAMGLWIDATGTVFQNYFTLLGVSQTVYDVLFGTSSSNKFIKIGQDLLNLIEDGLGNLAPSGTNPPIALCGRTFFERFTQQADVITAYQFFESTQQKLNPLREDIRYGDFEHGGIIWRQYRGSTADYGRFIPDNEAHIVIDGVPGTYEGYFCPPSDIMDKVNTPGLPIYPTVKVLDHGAGYEFNLQSNPVHAMTRPAVAIKLISSN